MLTEPTDAFAACRRAVLAGARYSVTSQPGPASRLAEIYALREEGTHLRGVATIGFIETVNRLRDRDEEPVRVAAVDTDDPPYHFQLFLDEHATAVLACFGVDQSWNPNRHLA